MARSRWPGSRAKGGRGDKVAETISPLLTRRSGSVSIAIAPGRRIVVLFCFVLCLLLLVTSWQLSPSLPPQLDFCHRVTPDLVEPSAAFADPHDCKAPPADYAHGWLWLRHDLSAEQKSWASWSFNMHFTRFERMVVHFRYENGAVETHRVRAGDFGDYWRPNGHLAFRARAAAPLESIVIGIDRLASYELLRMRLTPVAQQERGAQITATLVGGALSLLIVSFVYNLLLAVIARQPSALWHVGWVACMIAWGLCWSQLILLAAPQMAGATMARTCSLLAAGAIFLATRHLLALLEPGLLPRWLNLGLHLAAWLFLGFCLLSAFAPPGYATAFGNAFLLSTLFVFAFAVTAIVVGVIRGSEAARDFALAWSMPIMAVLASFTADHSATVPIVSGEMLVLGTSALQTLWLSYAATRGFALLRAERDQARARQSELMVLAETDPLTKLYNRRGLTERFRRELAKAEATGDSLGLMLIDLDHFKSVNDTFGHEVGDHVLQRVAGLLADLHAQGGIAARLGGEEFCVLLPGIDGEALHALADQTRRRLAESDMSAIFNDDQRRITASFGIIDTRQFPHADPAFLIRLADQALYQAKSQGRNRIIRANTHAAAPTNEHPAHLERPV